MRSQQQADREEQQRIKNLVLNYEAANEPEAAESKSIPVLGGHFLEHGY
jgi:regulator of nonsense transcripts 2